MKNANDRSLTTVQIPSYAWKKNKDHAKKALVSSKIYAAAAIDAFSTLSPEEVFKFVGEASKKFSESKTETETE